MVVGHVSQYIGTSIEHKPSANHVPIGSMFLETDTGDEYILNSSAIWTIKSKSVNAKARVSSMPYTYDIAEGNVPSHTLFSKYAINDDIDSANEEDIWCVGGNYTWPSAATLMAVISSSAEDDPAKADTSAGTGIWSVRVYYLDTSFVEHTVDVALNGTAEVNIDAIDIYRVNRIRPLTMGTGLKAAGNIDIKGRNPVSTIFSRIATGFTKGRQLIQTVPYGKTLYLYRVSGSIGGTTAPKYGRFVLKSTWDDISHTRMPG